ncbi:MAG: transketolase [Oscillospiraceae bacterium]
MKIPELKEKCLKVRRDIVNMVADAASGHPGGSLSAVELMVALFNTQMRVDPKKPKDPTRDRFVLSKGHAAPVYYATLCDLGFFGREELPKLRQLHAMLQGHPDAKKIPGVDASTGSLGQGVSIAVGMALGAKKSGSDIKVYALLGDGELQEGLVWEAAMAAANYKLDNLTVMVDNNGLQIDGTNNEVMALGDIAAKFSAFGFDVVEVKGGNDIEQVIAAYEQKTSVGKPKCILAHTVKGKGVSFMENQVGWHGKAPNAEQRAQAMKDLEG